MVNIQELKNLIYERNVPDRWYSINDGLKPNAFILYKNYSEWEFFFLDEKGERNDYKIFYVESQAYDYLWQQLLKEIKVFKVQPRNISK